MSGFSCVLLFSVLLVAVSKSAALEGESKYTLRKEGYSFCSKTLITSRNLEEWKFDGRKGVCRESVVESNREGKVMICENIYGIRVSVRSDNVIFQGNDGIGCFYSRVSVHQIRRGPRIWVWLGPLLGFIGAVAIIFAFSYFCFFRQASLEPSINEGNVRFSQSSTQNSRLLQSWIPKSTKQPETQQPSQLQRLSENWPAAQRNSPNYTSTAGSAQHSMARKEPEVIPEVEDEIQPAAQVASQTEGKTNDNDTGDSQANVEKNGTAEKGPEGTLEVEDENQPAAQGRCIIQ